MMIQSPTNVKLVDSLAQIILALSPEERRLLDQKVYRLPSDLDSFFVDLTRLPADSEQPSLAEISEVVHEVRQELWASS
jgi:hypothetical protein